jgi:threonine aldolase
VLCGSRELIEEGKRWRKMLGGGMRQAGVIAAAGLYALQHNVQRLAEDHDNAAFLAAELARIPGLSVTTPQTNIFYVDVPAGHCAPLAQALASDGIRVSMGPRLRLVTHLDVDRAQLAKVANAFARYFE